MSREHAFSYLTGCQDFDGEPNDAKAGREYFKKRFARLAQKANAKEREIYIQYVYPLLLLR